MAVVQLAEHLPKLKIPVTNGVTQDFEFEPGTTLKDVRRQAADLLNIAPTAVAEVAFAGSDEFVAQDEDYVLQSGDEVQYQKPAGEKG